MLLLVCGRATLAQETAPTPETVEDALRQMSDAASVIFVGEVMAIRQKVGKDGASGVVEVDFHIDQAVRGCSAGSVYTLREWAGLWAAGDQRYRTGQHLLMLLHAPGAAGISSPVGGMTGAIPIRGTASLPGAVSASASASPDIADLRWVGTRLQRTIPMNPSPLVTATGQASSGSAGATGDSSTASQQAPVSVVVEMLRSWQQDGR